MWAPLCVSLLVLAGAPLSAGETPRHRAEYSIPRTESPIKVDAKLDEPAWQEAARIDLPYETRPGENIPAPVATECLVTYDSRQVYIAFKAYDENPQAIRAHMVDRDTAFNDDFVGVVLDTFNDERRAFEFFVNPLGVQMDLFNDDLSHDETTAWDAIWFSAGRITEEGYVVEMAIPFHQLRFPSEGEEQTCRFDAIRFYPRSDRVRIASLTGNLALNPDFSQVEADVAQLDVNNPFALFYPEQ